MLDEYLLRRAQEGDKSALERLLRRYYDKIYAYCFHRVSDRQTAEDLCQETFCSMLEHLEEYRHYDKFQNYIYVIAGNKCKDFYKKKKAVPIGEMEEFAGQQASQRPGPEEEVSLRALVHRLPEELEEAVVLRFFQELKYQDIASILGISSSLAKYRVNKALSLLREELER